MRDGRDLSDGDEPLFVDHFANENYFSAALHEGGIAEVAQDKYEQGSNIEDDNINIDKDPDNPPGISLDPISARSKIARVPPPNPVELPGVSPQENPVELPVVAPPEN